MLTDNFGARAIVVVSAMIFGALGAGCGGGEPAPPDGMDGGRMPPRDAARADAPRPFDAGPPEPCTTPGAVENVACGSCGTVERFCTAGGTWAYGACAGEGICAPGTIGSEPCGACGTRASRCTAACVWEATGACMGEGPCTPGERVRTSEGCPAGQTHELLCSATCALEEVAPCMVDGCTTPGAVESVACGSCGTVDRFCTAARVWEYGTCVEMGSCTPGTTRMAPCGRCGTTTERCTAECSWVASACTGEGECVPGATRRTATGCGAGQTRLERCSDGCAFTSAGPCEGGVDGGRPVDAGRRDGGRVDAGCSFTMCATDADCCPGTTCLVPFGLCFSS